jgi:hypothetical protein
VKEIISTFAFVLHRAELVLQLSCLIRVRTTPLQRTAKMAKLDLPTVWADIKTYRRAYLLTAIASFGGMLFGESPSHSLGIHRIT